MKWKKAISIVCMALSLLAVTACPMGVAHTYLAAEALRKAAQERGVTIKVETNGAVGVNDELESDEIAAADCIITRLMDVKEHLD